jgi:hypothetical protein
VSVGLPGCNAPVGGADTGQPGPEGIGRGSHLMGDSPGIWVVGRRLAVRPVVGRTHVAAPQKSDVRVVDARFSPGETRQSTFRPDR